MLSLVNTAVNGFPTRSNWKLFLISWITLDKTLDYLDLI